MATYYLTERAAMHLRDIHIYTSERWGENQADKYAQKIVDQLQKIANNPTMGNQRKQRSEPYLMVPTEQHYAIYKPCKDGIIVAAILHSKRDIEAIMERIGIALAAEIKAIENNA